MDSRVEFRLQADASDRPMFVPVPGLSERNYCKGNWVKFIIHSTFCLVTVASFIIIVAGAIRRSPNYPPKENDKDPPRRCCISKCRVVCSQAPYQGDFEGDIIRTVISAGEQCRNLSLTLNRPEFINSSLPENWLSSTRANIVELNIIGGNLRHIKPDAFMSKFTTNIQTLVLEEITIEDWDPNMLVGLVRLKELNIRDSHIKFIRENALRPVDNTLQQLSIRTSGVFDPTNITGSSDLVQLHDVDLSTNDFGRILGSRSFRELRECKILRLTDSKISAIHSGAFDFLFKLEMLFLNNNGLVTIPIGLFDRIITTPLSQIDLQHNLWRCDCALEYTRQLSAKGFLMVHPACHFPKIKKGKYFSDFETFCDNDVEDAMARPKKPDLLETEAQETIYKGGECHSSSRKTRIILPLLGANCSFNNILNNYSISLSNITKHAKSSSPELRPTFFLISTLLSMVEISLNSSQRNYGVVWYNTKCPNEVYCVDSLFVQRLRLYNVVLDQVYTFCPLYVTGDVKSESCIVFNSTAAAAPAKGSLTLQVTMFMFAAVFGAGGLGAIVLYGLIRQYPTLLKGSKRVVIVKKKTAEALILPPKVPLRDHLVMDQNKERVFVVPSRPRELLSPIDSLSRSASIRSAKSNSPSYVSALQPSEDELMEWRLKQHFNSDLLVISPCSSLVPICWMSDNNEYPLQSNSEVGNSKET